jgi:peptidoglycan hydrolase-like protein with peptidoglycan-binding domain
VTLSFTNKSYGPQGFLASIIPQISDGTYDATKGRSISLSILPLGTASAPMGTNTANAITVPPGAAPTPTSTIKVTRPVQFSWYLQKGMKHSQVSELQKLLAQDKLLYPEGLVTGYFGPATDAALKRFQKRYGIAKEGDEGYGLVGPKTRAKLNTLMYF